MMVPPNVNRSAAERTGAGRTMSRAVYPNRLVPRRLPSAPLLRFFANRPSQHRTFDSQRASRPCTRATHPKSSSTPPQGRVHCRKKAFRGPLRLGHPSPRAFCHAQFLPVYPPPFPQPARHERLSWRKRPLSSLNPRLAIDTRHHGCSCAYCTTGALWPAGRRHAGAGQTAAGG